MSPSFRDLFGAISPRRYYDRLMLGLAYERYVVTRLRACGFLIAAHDTAAGQAAHGDMTCRFGDVEIKYDTRLASTGNVFIEIAEKQHATQTEWKPSGICGPARYLWIGNYREWALESCQLLIHKWHADHYNVTRTATAQGFLVPWDRVRQWAVWCGTWPENTPDQPSDGHS